MLLVKIIAAIAYISLGLPDAVLGIAWPDLRRDYDVPVDYLGLLLGATFTGYLLSSTLASTLSRFLGLGWLLAGSSATMTVVLLAYALGSHFYLLMLVGFVGGLGGGAIDASLNSVMAHRFSLRMMNWLHGCWGIGAFLGPLTMTWILATHRSWREGYMILAGALGITTMLLFATRRSWELTAEENETETPPRPSIWEVLKDRQVLGQSFLFFLYTGIEATVGQLFFTWWTEGKGLSAAYAGGAVTGYWLAFTLGRFGIGQLTAYWSGVTIVQVAGWMFPLLALFILFPVVPYLDLVLLSVLGCVIAPIFPTWIGLTPKTVRADMAPQAIGFQVSAAAIGIAVIPGVVSFVARRVGLECIPWSLLVIAVLFCLLQGRLLRGGKGQ